ncbi:CDO1 [Cordylochernes scorpioides]|uniref:Cysteine dioxygenase n=1 Tax=Cordylochernes scorpioides TaxID=51811 RepID=A0ABY6K1F8_9ARAC|nr:CDO1 [Cordylochernes scorpioides]
MLSGSKVPPVSDLRQLQAAIDEVFQEDHVNIEYVSALLSAYKSNSRDWACYAKFDPHKYTRNLVSRGNGKYNLMVLCWSEGQASSIHSHAGSHCFMKVLSGSLKELKYDWPDSSRQSEMTVREENLLQINDVAYINDSLGLHRMENPNHTECAVSLHLYSPSFSECTVFDQRTSRQTCSRVTFWSIYGRRASPDSLLAPDPTDSPEHKERGEELAEK